MPDPLALPHFVYSIKLRADIFLLFNITFEAFKPHYGVKMSMRVSGDSRLSSDLQGTLQDVSRMNSNDKTVKCFNGIVEGCEIAEVFAKNRFTGVSSLLSAVTAYRLEVEKCDMQSIVATHLESDGSSIRAVKASNAVCRNTTIGSENIKGVVNTIRLSLDGCKIFGDVDVVHLQKCQSTEVHGQMTVSSSNIELIDCNIQTLRVCRKNMFLVLDYDTLKEICRNSEVPEELHELTIYILRGEVAIQKHVNGYKCIVEGSSFDWQEGKISAPIREDSINVPIRLRTEEEILVDGKPFTGIYMSGLILEDEAGEYLDVFIKKDHLSRVLTANLWAQLIRDKTNTLFAPQTVTLYGGHIEEIRFETREGTVKFLENTLGVQATCPSVYCANGVRRDVQAIKHQRLAQSSST